MNIAEEIYQHAKQLPTDKALEVLKFIATIEVIVDNVDLSVKDNLCEHPFFGMNRDEQETVETVMNRLRGSRY